MAITHYCRYHEFHIQSPKIKPTKLSQDSKSSIEEISIRFTYQSSFIRSRFTEDSEQKIIHKKTHRKIFLRYHKLSVEIFKEGDDSLFRYLSKWLSRYGLTENIRAMADAIIAKWNEVRVSVSSNYDRKVFPMIVDLEIINSIISCERCALIRDMEEICPELLYEEDEEEDCGMIPACKTAAKKLLKKVESESESESETEEEESSPRRKRRRMGDGRENCSICLEKMKEEEEDAMEMPCSHIFHGDCITKWLRKSHYCPICRFQMPTS